jgi:rRNA maturation RNase YbeY
MTVRIVLNLTENWPAVAGIAATLSEAAKAALRTTPEPPSGEIGITFVTDVVMRELNLRYLGRSGSTDVIAFELGDDGVLIGDVYVAPEVAARTAAELGISEEEELVRLVVHGILHLLGHDHPEGDDRYASPMFRLQEELVGRLTRGIP